MNEPGTDSTGNGDDREQDLWCSYRRGDARRRDTGAHRPARQCRPTRSVARQPERIAGADRKTKIRVGRGRRRPTLVAPRPDRAAPPRSSSAQPSAPSRSCGRTRKSVGPPGFGRDTAPPWRQKPLHQNVTLGTCWPAPAGPRLESWSSAGRSPCTNSPSSWRVRPGPPHRPPRRAADRCGPGNSPCTRTSVLQSRRPRQGAGQARRRGRSVVAKPHPPIRLSF